MFDPAFVGVIADAGFQSVRIPVRWSNHASLDDKAQIDETFARCVDQAVRYSSRG